MMLHFMYRTVAGNYMMLHFMYRTVAGNCMMLHFMYRTVAGNCMMLHFMYRTVAGIKGQLVRDGVQVREDTACYGKGQQGALHEQSEATSHWRATPGSWLDVGPGSGSASGNEELGRKVGLVRHFPCVQPDMDTRYVMAVQKCSGPSVCCSVESGVVRLVQAEQVANRHSVPAGGNDFHFHHTCYKPEGRGFDSR
jgi:hypothetical protein